MGRKRTFLLPYPTEVLQSVEWCANGLQVYDGGALEVEQPGAGGFVGVAADKKRVDRAAAVPHGVRILPLADDCAKIGDGLCEHAVLEVIDPIGMRGQHGFPAPLYGVNWFFLAATGREYGRKHKGCHQEQDNDVEDIAQDAL